MKDHIINKQCPVCRGYGNNYLVLPDEEGYYTCEKCKGKGFIKVVDSRPDPYDLSEQRKFKKKYLY